MIQGIIEVSQAIGMKNQLRHLVYILVHAIGSKEYLILLVHLPLYTLVPDIAIGLVVEKSMYELHFIGCCIISLYILL